MANELTLNASLNFTKGTRKVLISKANIQVDVAGTDFVHMTQTIGTSAEALDLGDITTPGYIFIFNRDTTNFIEVRDGASGADVVKVGPGKVALFELATATPNAIADTAAVEVEYVIIEA